MTTYKTDCGCIESAPQPIWDKYRDDDQYNSYLLWSRKWDKRAQRHECSCPKSAYYGQTGHRKVRVLTPEHKARIAAGVRRYYAAKARMGS